MEGEVSVGIVAIESLDEGGPRFEDGELDRVHAKIVEGLNWLAEQAPVGARLTWVYDWQHILISAADDSGDGSAAYYLHPAMAELEYCRHRYSAGWNAVMEYREDMRQRNVSRYAIAIFTTPYAYYNAHADLSHRAVFLPKRGDWPNHGLDFLNGVAAHEVCHLFGATDEYNWGDSTRCSTCESLHGCNQIPNGNCTECARPRVGCLMMLSFRDRICDWTRAHIGWSGLFVELTTADENEAGSEDNVWLDIGDRAFPMRNADYPERQSGNRDGYVLSYKSVTAADIKRIGIRKARGGDDWKLQRLRAWLDDTLICDEDNLDRWFTNSFPWWASLSAGSPSSGIVNLLQVYITTGSQAGAGTDDRVYLYLGGQSWLLHHPAYETFDRGETNVFQLDPGTGMYRSDLDSIRIAKVADGPDGGWLLDRVRVAVNTRTIYDEQNINMWLEGDDREWQGTIP
jgi:hypothetical protein